MELATDRQRQAGRLVERRAPEWHLLKPAAPFARRLQPDRAELRRDIAGGDQIAARTRVAPLKAVRGEKLHVGADAAGNVLLHGWWRLGCARGGNDKQGGDNRCSCDNPRNPPVAAPCTIKHAHVAYILRSEATDRTGPKYQEGEYSFFIDVTDQNITKDEDANPVKTLRMRYDASKKKG